MQKSESEILSEIATKRREHELRKKDIETEIRNRVETELAESWNEVRRAIWDAKRGGLAIAKIARAYGTTNRATIYSIVAEMPTYLAGEELTFLKTGEPAQKSDLTPTVTAVPNTIANKPGWEVTLPDGAKLEVYRAASGVLMPIGPNKARWAENPELVDLIENLS